MELYIYRLEGCKTCLNRQGEHNKIANLLREYGVETKGVLIGMINGERHVPLEKHDALCRKADDYMKYQAPVYILETEKDIVKLEDLSNYTSGEAYVEYIIDLINGMED